MKKKKGNQLQRLMSVLLSALLIAGTVSGAFPTEVSAAENTVSGNMLRESASQKEVRYSTDGGNSWTEAGLMEVIWSSDASAQNLQIELLRDITLVGTTGGNWGSYQQILGRQDNTWTIDGKGHTITRGEGTEMLFCINQPNSKVTLKDITIDGGAVWNGDNPAERTNSGISLSGNKHLMYVGGGAELVLESGVVLQNNDIVNYDGAAIVVGYSDGAGTLTIKEGVEIRNNSARQGGAIWVYNSGSVVNMEGGKIFGNHATSGGGAVYNMGTFYMKGGEISGNAADNNSGAVLDNGSFKMSNGKICGNKAGAGGGISAFNGNTVITGGSVTDNTITGTMGGGILVHNGSLTISGSVVVTGNTGGGAANNVYLSTGKVISVSTPLSDGTRVGVTTKKLPEEGAPVAVTAACNEDCSACLQSDNASYDIINDTSSNIIQLAVHTHQYSEDWSMDENGHWHECRCGVKADEAAHTEDDGTVTEEPNATEEGVKTYKCSTCGYVMRTEPIDKTGGDDMPDTPDTPDTPDAGNVETDKEQGTDAPDTDFGTSKEELISAVLTQEDKDSIVAGTDAKIVLIVDNIDDSVSEADKETVTAKAENNIVGEYLDVSLFKIVGSNKTAVGQTNRKIRLVITIPERLKNTDAEITRTYAVVRVHDGVAEMLYDLDSENDTITIETDKFSTYALVYHDSDKNAGDNGDEGNGNEDNGNEDNGNGDNGNSDNGNSDNGNGDNGNGDNGNGSNGIATAVITAEAAMPTATIKMYQIQ